MMVDFLLNGIEKVRDMNKLLMAKKLIKIAKSLIADEQTGMIENREDFNNAVEGQLFESLEFIGDYAGKDYYSVDTNGNDDVYSLKIFADDNAVYYGQAVITEDDLDRNGYNASPEWDEYMYKYDSYPFSLNEFENWINKTVKSGVNEGRDVLKNYDPFINLPVNQYVEEGGELLWKLNIPDYALSYLVDGDDSGLQDEELKEIDEWESRMNVYRIDPTNEKDEFNINPAFGKPCSITVCKVYTGK